ncbi:Colicin V production protein [Rhodopirellula baltica SH28]|uniref:Colicin V production protein n=2 Tax=Rhodopirellula baltica TaxID=265606 RepID=K5C855_RHOBT|nr:CvpA family protein [Rhodopirellula baltica]EKJ99144.1 Colicin V production protein [Rhodopirellula baltica SH28]ELP32102.1 Colicin V production protein [Rhodopirellula baltica SWK14]
MQTYDILMTVILVGATLLGAIRGFAWQLASIASIVVSYCVAYHYREPFSQNIHAAPPWNQFLAMFILFVGTSFVIWVALRMVSGMIDRMRLKEFDRQIGALFGLAKGALLCTIITLFAVTLFGERTQRAIVASESGRLIARVLAESNSIMPPELDSVVRPYLDQFSDEELGEPSASEGSWLSQTPIAPNVDPNWSHSNASSANNFAPQNGFQQAQNAPRSQSPFGGFGGSSTPTPNPDFNSAARSQQPAPTWRQSATPQWQTPRR